MGRAAEPMIVARLTIESPGAMSDEDREALAHWLRYEAAMLTRDGESYPDTEQYLSEYGHSALEGLTSPKRVEVS